MVNNKVAFLVDGAFFMQRFEAINKKLPKVIDLEKYVQQQISQIQAKTGSDSKDILFRILYYDCLPYEKELKDPSTKAVLPPNKFCEYKKRFIATLKNKDFMALRLGTLSLNGWKLDTYSGKHKPDFKQKGVDMKIGLDMAWMASRKTIDKIALITGDADFISPMKLVRREGILVYLMPMGQKVKAELAEHADFIIN